MGSTGKVAAVEEILGVIADLVWEDSVRYEQIEILLRLVYETAFGLGYDEGWKGHAAATQEQFVSGIPEAPDEENQAQTET